MIKHNKETILKILHGIHDIKIIGGELYITHKDTPHIDESINSFIYGSFSYSLLLLIETHLNGNKADVIVTKMD
jgi:hypothetical protein